MYRIDLKEAQHSLMGNALRLAADRYAETAKELREAIPAQHEAEKECPDTAFIMTAAEAERLVEQFERQERETRELIELLGEAEEI